MTHIATAAFKAAYRKRRNARETPHTRLSFLESVAECIAKTKNSLLTDGVEANVLRLMRPHIGRVPDSFVIPPLRIETEESSKCLPTEAVKSTRTKAKGPKCEVTKRSTKSKPAVRSLAPPGKCWRLTCTEFGRAIRSVCGSNMIDDNIINYVLQTLTVQVRGAVAVSTFFSPQFDPVEPPHSPPRICFPRYAETVLVPLFYARH